MVAAQAACPCASEGALRPCVTLCPCPRPKAAPSMIFRQVTHDDLGCASYLIGDESAGVAAVVDPKLDIDEYLRLARYFGVSIEHILETHNHADHVSGHGRLAAATGATIHINRIAEAEYDHQPFDDGFELELGPLRVRAMHTPGHRPEHTAFVLTDSARGDEPWAVLSGDSLFVGDIARPDLAVDKEEGAQGIFHSLRDRLLALPGACEVWPGHLGGSLCGGPGHGHEGVLDHRASSASTRSCCGSTDEQRFVSETTAALGPAAAELREHRRAQPRPARARQRGAAPARPAPGRAAPEWRRARGRRPHRAAVRRGPHPRRRLHDRPPRRLRLEARLARRRRGGRASSSSAATTRRRAGQSRSRRPWASPPSPATSRAA